MNTSVLVCDWTVREIFRFSEPGENISPRFVRILLDNRRKIHYIHSSRLDIDFGNCRKDQVAEMPCSRSIIMRWCMLYLYKTRNVTLSVQEGILHVSLLFVVRYHLSTLHFPRITSTFSAKYWKTHCSIGGWHGKSRIRHTIRSPSLTVNSEVRLQRGSYFSCYPLFTEVS